MGVEVTCRVCGQKKIVYHGRSHFVHCHRLQSILNSSGGEKDNSGVHMPESVSPNGETVPPAAPTLEIEISKEAEKPKEPEHEYLYQCSACGYKFDDWNDQNCPSCNKELKKNEMR